MDVNTSTYLAELLDLGLNWRGCCLALSRNWHLLLQSIDVILDCSHTPPLPTQVACVPSGHKERDHHYWVDE